MSRITSTLSRRSLLKSTAATGLFAATSGLALPFYARAASAPSTRTPNSRRGAFRVSR